MGIPRRWMFPLLTGVLLTIAACGSDSNDNSQEQVGAAPVESVENMSVDSKGTCAPPSLRCKGACANPLTDNHNCGKCGVPGGSPCVNGVCPLVCNRTCPPGTYCCYVCAGPGCGWGCLTSTCR